MRLRHRRRDNALERVESPERSEGSHCLMWEAGTTEHHDRRHNVWAEVPGGRVIAPQKVCTSSFPEPVNTLPYVAKKALQI